MAVLWGSVAKEEGDATSASRGKYRAYLEYAVSSTSETTTVVIASCGVKAYGKMPKWVYSGLSKLTDRVADAMAYSGYSGEDTASSRRILSQNREYADGVELAGRDLGWYAEFPRGHSAYTVSDVAEAWAYVGDEEYSGLNVSETAKLSVTIPAKPSYAVSYNANGGSGAPGAQTKWHGEPLVLQPGQPKRPGHYFRGWATSPSGAAAYQPGATYSGNAALALYAVWEPFWAVSYNDNGVACTGMPASQVKNMNVPLRLSGAEPAVADRSRTFLGWATEPKGPVAYAPGAVYSGNGPLSLYAVWRLEWSARFGRLRVERCGEDGRPDGMGRLALVEGSVDVEGAMDVVAEAVLLRPEGGGWAEAAVADIAGGSLGKPQGQDLARMSWSWLSSASGAEFQPDEQASFRTGVRLYERREVQGATEGTATAVPVGRDSIAAGETYETVLGYFGVTSAEQRRLPSPPVVDEDGSPVEQEQRAYADMAWENTPDGLRLSYTRPEGMDETAAAWLGTVDVCWSEETVSESLSLLADIAGPSVTMTRGTPVLDLHSSGRGMGIGDTAPEEGLRVGWPLKSWADFFPPGFIYLSSLPTSPAERFGGVWIEIKNEGFLRLAGNFLAGGSNSKTIAAANMPAHTHGIPAHGHAGNAVNTGNQSGGHYHYAAGGSGYGAARMNNLSDDMGADIYNGALSGSGYKVFRRRENTGLSYVRDTGSGLSASHYHGVTTSVKNCAWFRSESAGSGTALDVTPRYQNVYAWRRATPQEEAALAAG